jgi:pumilio homology domain family member 6
MRPSQWSVFLSFSCMLSRTGPPSWQLHLFTPQADSSPLHCSTLHFAVFLKAFKGRAAELLRHPAGTHVLDDLYAAASASQRNIIAAEFYGREYVLFRDGTLNNAQGPPAKLQDLLQAVDVPKRRAIIAHLAASISGVIEKGLVDSQLAHRLIAEYLDASPASLVVDALESLSGDALLHMLHTRHGATAACAVFAYGTAKDRKKAVRALKGHVSAAARDEWGHLALITALSVVDDTALLKKLVLKDLVVSSLPADNKVYI